MDTSITVASQTLIVLLRELSSPRHKRDKNDICVGYFLTNQTILNWYNSLTAMLTAEMVKSVMNPNSKRTPEELDSLFKYIYGSEYGPAAQASIEFLLKVQTEYESGELRKLVKEQDIQILFNLSATLVPRFINCAKQGVSEQFSLEKLRTSCDAFDEAETIRVWLMIWTA